LDGNFPKLRGAEQFKYSIYYSCATQFGWDKETVDRQEIDYLAKLFATHKSQVEEAEKKKLMPPLGRNIRKNL
jgi:hypothetical protein